MPPFQRWHHPRTPRQASRWASTQAHTRRSCALALTHRHTHYCPRAARIFPSFLTAPHLLFSHHHGAAQLSSNGRTGPRPPPGGCPGREMLQQYVCNRATPRTPAAFVLSLMDVSQRPPQFTIITHAASHPTALHTLAQIQAPRIERTRTHRTRTHRTQARAHTQFSLCVTLHPLSPAPFSPFYFRYPHFTSLPRLDVQNAHSFFHRPSWSILHTHKPNPQMHRRT